MGSGLSIGGIYYSNPKVTEAVQKGNSATDFGEQKKFYCEAQKLIAEDAPVAFLHDDLRLTPFWKYVKGYKYPVGAMFFEHRFERFYMDTNDPLFLKNQ
jgi:peptide/nickel transport system substrate-binding protein